MLQTVLHLDIHSLLIPAAGISSGCNCRMDHGGRDLSCTQLLLPGTKNLWRFAERPYVALPALRASRVHRVRMHRMSVVQSDPNLSRSGR